MSAFLSCPICGLETRVTETRVNPAGLRRRRACITKTCKGRLTTLELVVGDKVTSKNTKHLAIVSLEDIDELAALIQRWREKAAPL